MRALQAALGVLAALAVCLAAAPAFAATGSTWFASTTGSCFALAPTLESDQLTPVDLPDEAMTRGDTPCAQSLDDGSDASANICHEAANSPMSTWPALLARAQAHDAASRVINRLRPDIEPSGGADQAEFTTATPDPSTPGFARNAPPLPVDVQPDIACTTHTEECRSLPPTPLSLHFDAPASATRRSPTALKLPSSPSTPPVRPWAPYRLRPLAGHLTLLDRPPELA